MQRTAWLLLLLVAVVLALPAFAADNVNITGEWQITINTENGTFTPVAVINQEGEKLTGTYKGRFGESKLEGSITGKAVMWKATINVQDQDVTLTYKGELTDNDSMKGTAQMGEYGTADWTAKRAKKQ